MAMHSAWLPLGLHLNLQASVTSTPSGIGPPDSRPTTLFLRQRHPHYDTGRKFPGPYHTVSHLCLPFIGAEVHVVCEAIVVIENVYGAHIGSPMDFCLLHPWFLSETGGPDTLGGTPSLSHLLIHVD